MKQVIFNKFGPADVLQVAQVAKPKIHDDEVLLKMKASSVNGADLIQRQGIGVMNKKFPKTLGLDVMGTVVKVGSGVKNYKIGDHVWGNVNVHHNAWAEYVNVPVKYLAHLPQGVNSINYACLPTTAVTALTALQDKGHLKAGQRILIRGVGGVGMNAVQIAHSMGAEVVTLAGSHREEILKLGADQFYNYHTTNLNKLGSFDWILDTVGGDLEPYRKLLKKNGTLLTIAIIPYDKKHPVKNLLRSVMATLRVHRRIAFVVGTPLTERLNRLNRLVEEGKIKPIVDSTYDMDDIVAANQRASQRGTWGKVIIKIP